MHISQSHGRSLFRDSSRELRPGGFPFGLFGRGEGEGEVGHEDFCDRGEERARLGGREDDVDWDWRRGAEGEELLPEFGEMRFVVKGEVVFFAVPIWWERGVVKIVGIGRRMTG